MHVSSYVVAKTCIEKWIFNINQPITLYVTNIKIKNKII